MKLISFAVPCYNSQAYMKKCIESLLLGGELVEIIIVDDGSSDKTGEIADLYGEKYPDIVRVIHQENKGHGGAINTALAAAEGVFFKVVDSDDYVGQKAYSEVLEKMTEFDANNHFPDMFIVNYVYDKVGIKRKRRMTYTNCCPEERFFTWSELGHTNIHQYFLMHAVIYKTSLLKEVGLTLPEHRFYVDNLFVYLPMPRVRELYYLNVDFYRYFIGRADQSVNEKIMIGRIDQQLTVTRELIDAYSFEGEQKCRLYQRRYLRIMMEVSSSLCIISEDPELVKKKNDLWLYLKNHNKRLYRKLRYQFAGWTCFMPVWIVRPGYKVFNMIYGFN